jgi:hypothetical protein
VVDELRVLPSARRLVKDHLKWLLERRHEVFTIGIGQPDSWSPDSEKPHIAVDSDGTPVVETGWGRVSPIEGRGPIRITVYANGTTEADRLANLCMGLLLVSKPRGRGLSAITGGTGPNVADAPENVGGELTFFTITATVSSVSL